MNSRNDIPRRCLVLLIFGLLILSQHSGTRAQPSERLSVIGEALGPSAPVSQPLAESTAVSLQHGTGAETRLAIGPHNNVSAARGMAKVPDKSQCDALVDRIEDSSDAAVKADPEVDINLGCSLELPSTAIVKKRLVFAGANSSGAILQCTCDANRCTTLNGKIFFTAFDTDRPENIAIRNCRITADVRIGPIPGAAVTKRPDFEAWIRARAPRRITFDHVTIAGSGKDRFYVAWGTTDTKLINSVIEGEASGVPIYLAPHSSRTLIQNTEIRTVTTATNFLGIGKKERESISIDGSDYNRIISNRFGALNRGGIYLFRNCGENGGIRHTTPSHNQIINNLFFYRNYAGPKPAVFLGSRDGHPPGFHPLGFRNYCDNDEDKNYPYGSGKDNQDFATHNVVMQNLIVKRREADVIRSKDWVNNAMNLIEHNTTVSEKRAKWPRPPAGCYVRGGEKEFIRHLQSTERFMDDKGSATCDSVTCNDGELRRDGPAVVLDSANDGKSSMSASIRAASACMTRRVPIDCRISNDKTNKGCETTVTCPAGTKVVGAVAACNLEFGRVSDTDLASVPASLIHVSKLSDKIRDGSCHIGNNRVVGSKQLVGGGLVVIPRSAVQIPIRGIVGLGSVEVGCNEHDGNGGDCHIRGSLYCR